MIQRYCYILDISHNTMTTSQSFAGPPCKNFEDLRACVVKVPKNHICAFDYSSGLSLAAVCDPSALHIYEMDSELDSLIMLTQIVLRVRATNTFIPQVNGPVMIVPTGMIIVVEHKASRDNFTRLCQQMKHITQEEGHLHLGDTYCSFGAIALVKGVDNANVPNKDGVYPPFTLGHIALAVKRINIAIERIIQKCTYNSERLKNIVWHHGPVIHFLNHFIANTTSNIRNRIKAVTIHNALSFKTGINPSPCAHSLNKSTDIDRLRSYLERLNLSATFLDAHTQGIDLDVLSNYIWFSPYYVHTLLPGSLLQPHYYHALDTLLLFSYRLRGAVENTYNTSVVQVLKNHTNSRAIAYAKESIKPSNYTKELCRAAGTDKQIHHACALADSPFALLRPMDANIFPAFTRLFVGPVALDTAAEYYVSVPLEFHMSKGQYRVSSSSHFRLHMPHPALAKPTGMFPDAPNRSENITERVRGVFNGVVEAMRTLRGDPVMSNEERVAWTDARKACEWALEGTKDKLPKGMGEKVNCVEERFKGGMWNTVIEGMIGS
jgi:hypothetical protein